MNKKASARDVLVAGVLLFILGIGFFIANFAIGSTVDGLLSVPIINASSNETSGVLQTTKTLANKFDYVFAGFFVALVLGVLITGWFVGGQPIFMSIYFLINVLAVLISGILSNFWTTLSQASVFGTTASNFPITNQILGNLQVYVAIIGIIGIVVMFAKPYFQESGGGI